MADSLSSAVDAHSRPARRRSRRGGSTKLQGRQQATGRARSVRASGLSVSSKAAPVAFEAARPSPDLARGAQALRELPWPPAVLDAHAQLTADDTYSVGRLIVEVVHGGERDTQKSRKEWSLRRLQQEVLTNASFATLARCVQTYETCRLLGVAPPLGGVRAGHLLNMSHLSVAKQRALLAQVDRQSLSVQQLRCKTGRLPGQGRRRKPGVMKALTALEKQDLLADIEQLASIDRGEGKRLNQAVAQLQQQLREVRRHLRKHGFS